MKMREFRTEKIKAIMFMAMISVAVFTAVAVIPDITSGGTSEEIEEEGES